MPQFARPDSTVTAGGWTGVGVAALWDNLNETSASDADYDQTASGPVNDAMEVGLTDVSDPLVGTGHIVRYRLSKDAAAGRTIDITVELRQGTTVIASWVESNVSETFTLFEHTLATAEADAITSYTDLRLRIIANQTGSGAGRRGRISWAEVEIPFVAQFINPGGIASEEAVGTPGLSLGAVNVAPGGITSSEAFGSVSAVPGLVNVSPGSIASLEAFGNPNLITALSPLGIASLEAFGNMNLVRGSITVIPTGIASQEAFGTPLLQLIVKPTTIASAELFGAPSVLMIIQPTAIASLEAFGSPTIQRMLQEIIPTGILSAEAFGLANVVPGQIFISGAGDIETSEAFGSHIVKVTFWAVGPFPEIDYYQVILVGKAGTGGRVIELPRARATQIVWELNGAGMANITMPTSDLQTRDLKFIEREVQIWRKGQLLWWGVPWRMHADVHNHFFQCEGLWSYFFRRVIEDTRTYVQADQHNIAWDLLNYTQTTHGDFGIDAGSFLGSGVLRDRTYNKDEHQHIGDLVGAFTKLINGFDFDIEIDGSGSRLWTPYYPSKGTLQSAKVLEWGRNIIDYRYRKDANALATKAIITGEGDGPTRPEGSYIDAVAAAQYGYFIEVQSESDISQVETLNAKAEALVKNRNKPVLIPEVQLKNEPVELIGVIDTGDRFPVRIDHGATFIDQTLRMIRLSLDPPTDTMWCSFNEVLA